MLEGGVGMAETLQSVGSKIQNPYFKEKILEIETYVSSWDALSKSFKKIPQVFSPWEVAMVESGEATGKLSQSLDRLSKNLKKSHDLRSKIKSALTYPSIIFSFLVFAIVLVLVYVIPALSELFDNSGVGLPIATQMLIGTSNFIIYNWFLIILLLLMLVIVSFVYKNTESGKANIDSLILSLPLIGKVYRNYLLANFATNFGNLISSGVSVVSSLRLAGKSLNNAVYEHYILEVEKKVTWGSKIVDSFSEVDPDHHCFPQDYLQMLAVGEKTASLEKVSERLSEQYTREVQYSVANMTKWIEPLAILISGVFVLWFAFAIFGAILKVTQTVS